ncbi:MAG: metallophosphoesterase [Chloroflexota bacterium]
MSRDQNKLTHWVKKTAVIGSIAGLASLVYANQIEAKALTVETVHLPITDLHPALEGFKIVQMSDFHLHPYTKLPFIEKAVALANSLQPDLIALTGDFVLRELQSVRDIAPALAKLKARYGVFCSMGNHDVKITDTIVPPGLRRAGLTVLRNQGELLNVGAAQLYVAGVDDCIYGRPSLQTAMADWQPNALTVLLAHEPDVADSFSRDPRIALQLSGHTHGGQVTMPGYGPLILPRYGKKYHTGLYRVGQMWLYVTRGVGVGGLPIRFNCPPEVTEIILGRG